MFASLVNESWKVERMWNIHWVAAKRESLRLLRTRDTCVPASAAQAENISLHKAD